MMDQQQSNCRNSCFSGGNVAVLRTATITLVTLIFLLCQGFLFLNNSDNVGTLVGSWKLTSRNETILEQSQSADLPRKESFPPSRQPQRQSPAQQQPPPPSPSPRSSHSQPSPHDDDSTRTTKTSAEKYDVCFTISIYGTSVDSVDDVDSVLPSLARRAWKPDETKKNATFGFYAFTNLEDLPLPEPYRRILLGNLTLETSYRRWITYSRLPKFMAWTFDFILQGCATVVYFDAWKKLWGTPRVWKDMAQTLLSLPSSSFDNTTNTSFSTMRLMQTVKETNKLANQWHSILRLHKDLPENVNVTRGWIEAQPDYDANLNIYVNAQFMYVPTCPQWQQATTAFWNRYSQELGSWRDQPLWGYILHHLKLRPALPFTNYKELILATWGNRQNRKHVYNETQNDDAAEAAKLAKEQNHDSADDGNNDEGQK